MGPGQQSAGGRSGVSAALFVAVGLALGFGPTGSAVAQPTTPSTTRPGLDRRVLVIGDSVMVGAGNAVAARLAATGWQPTVKASESQHTYDSEAVVDANRAAMGTATIVSLGTNDGASSTQFAGWIDDLMGHLRDVPRVYWVNLRQFAAWVPAANAEIQSATKRWPNLRVIDWDARASADPSLAAGDGIHLTTAGQGAMAELLGSTLDAFAVEPPPTTTTTSPAGEAAGSGSDSEDSSGTNIIVVVLAVGAFVLLVGVVLARSGRRRPRGRHSPPRGGPRRRPPPPGRRAPAPPARRPPSGGRRPPPDGRPPRAGTGRPRGGPPPPR